MPRSRVRSSIDLDGIPSLTVRSQQGLADINQIVARGIPPVTSPGSFVDLVDRPDFLQASNTVATVSQGFARLPAKLRDYCSNDPSVYLELLHAVQGGEAPADALDLLVSSGVLKRTQAEPKPPPPVVEADPVAPPSQVPNDDLTTI